MSPTAIVLIVLAIAAAGDVILAKLYVGAREDVARITQAFDSFKADVKVMGEKAAADAAKQKADDEKRKRDADAENAATLAARDAAIGKLRADRDRARGNFLSAATACPASPAGADRYRSEYSGAYRDLVAGLRAQGDRGGKAVDKLNGAKKWAQGK